MNRKELVVSTNADSGLGSLRAALEQTQRKPGSYDIVFQSNARADNNLGTGYFTIALESALPNIYRSDIKINTDAPRSVTILPRSASGGQNARTPQSLTARASDGASSSLLTIGDILGIYSNNFVRRQAPKVEINGVNFVRNRAQGGNGVRGAGGGLGAGGAITFLEGTLKISNSVFQDLNASAGSGGPWANGGNGTFQPSIVSPIRRNSDGQSGGDGGISSIPYSRDVSGVMAYSAPRVAGGAGGRAGVEDSGGFILRSRHNGQSGGSGSSAAQLPGYGGGGGGGGGGRGRFPLAYGLPGPGGAGGVAGSFGGSGNGGGGGNGGNGGGGGASTPTAGTNGTEGFAIGGAIATLNPSNQGATNRFGEQRLILESVDFYNVSATALDSRRIVGNILAGPIGTPSRFGVVAQDVFFGSGRTQRTLLNTAAPQAGFTGLYATPTAPIAEDLPFQDGSSAPRAQQVADTRDVVLMGNPGFSDNFLVRYETGSTLLGIATDLTDPENPFNRIWRELVPDREQEILDEYYSAVNTGYWEAIFTSKRAEDILWDLGKSALKAGVKAAGGGAIADSLPTPVFNIFKDSIAYANSLGDRANQLDADLAANAARQDELQRYLREASGSAQIGQVDVSLQRSRVIVQNFELGRDSLVIPAADGRAQRIAFSISRSSTGTSALDFLYDTGSSTDVPFLSVELDARSDRIVNNRQIPLSQYVNSMLRPSEDGKSFVLGARLNEPIVLDSLSYTGGPASTTVIVDRRVPLGERITVETSIGDDEIFGSDGDELINADSGNDLIFPGFGVDRINGGKGVDLVSYVIDEKALRFKSAGNGSIEVSPLPGQGNFVNSVLTDIEGIHAYGKSQIDLSTILRPENDVFGVISGSGSQITGSNFDDNIEISFFSDYNASIEAAYRETSVINGGSGFNRLRLNFEEAPDPLALAFSDQGRTLNITAAPPDSSQEVNLIDAQNIDFFDIVFGEDSQKFDLGQAFPSQRLAADGESNLSPNSSPVSIVKIHAGGGKDILFGNQADNQLYGDLGNDILDGRDGNDLLVGGGGNDDIRGGRGKDHLYSTGGRDVLTSGKGADSFHFSGKKTDTITDFNPAEGDRIVLDEVEGEAVYSIAESKREVRQLKKAGIVNFIYRESKEYALWRGDGMDSFRKIKFESSVPSSVLMGSVFGRQSSPSASSFFMEQPVDSQLPIF